MNQNNNREPVEPPVPGYQVITRTAVSEAGLKRFENAVLAEIRNGWECLGGISISQNQRNAEVTYAQALIKRK